MKRYKLKVDSPWGKKGEIFSWYIEYFIYEQNKQTGSYIKSIKTLHPEDYPDIFEEIQEQSDEEWLAEYIYNNLFPRIEDAPTNPCKWVDITMFQYKYISLAKSLINNGSDVKKLRGKNEI